MYAGLLEVQKIFLSYLLFRFFTLVIMDSIPILFIAFVSYFFNMYHQEKPFTLQLWQGRIPGAVNGAEKKWPKPSEEDRCIERISNPEIEVFLPAAGKATGTAVLIMPGGGYGKVCIHHEGYDLARWFAERGVAGIVLKYRLPSDELMIDKSIGPLQDAQEAMRLIRSNAKKWKIDSQKVGVMGFSAGGHLASTLSTHYKENVYESQYKTSARPDFSILIYPVISFDEGITHMGSRISLIGNAPDSATVKRFSNEIQVTKDTPPAFLVHSADDKAVPVMNSIKYFEALQQHQVPAELHIYQRGGHGYGVGEKDSAESAWPEACLNWMKAGGWL